MDTVDTIYQEYSARCKELTPVEIGRVKRGTEQRFSISGNRKKIRVDAEGKLAAAMGIVQAGVGILSGFFPESYGEIVPNHPLRTLWHFGNKAIPEDYSARLIELGYNCLITDQDVDLQPEITVVKKLSFLTDVEGSFDGILWESKGGDLEHPQAESMTYAELIFAELEALEKKSDKQIFFSFNGGVKVFEHLVKHAGKKSVILFPASDNSIWNFLRTELVYHCAPIMPVIEFGNYGLWPAAPYDLIHHPIHAMEQDFFLGAAVKNSYIPKVHTIPGSQLWLLGHSQVKKSPIADLLQTWLLAFHPEWSIDPQFFFDARTIALGVNALDTDSFEEKALILRKVGAELAHLEYRIGKTHGEIREIFTHFISEVQKLL